MTDVIFATLHNSAQFERNSALKINKLSLVGMQLPEKYKEISTFRAKAFRLELLAGSGKLHELLH
jgi:hypothetical protein